ncbi:hypothetical protein OPKNFCMD_5341 [Methylobacterium crusticola]|uniref:N-acetyltransferase domain-containing protein n=1 Tax=Methylobacterium crusticola TaxID=1697972 RepID=A0ABQ4R4F4_9HYPH|nr:GNAT family N-acetyltransferase [Methylobacterium crusticola]GJD52575.1 hypothetical protein OPKNFCMD_5341 [Methylobacterium crusticola]
MTDTLAGLPPSGTERLALRPLEEADAPALQRISDDPAITGVVHILTSPFGLAEARGLIRGDGRGRDRFVGAWRRTDGALVGVVGTHLRGRDRIEIGYWVAGAAQRQGYGREAVAGIIALLRRHAPRRAIVAECREANLPSWRLLTGLGFAPSAEPGTRPGRRLLVLAQPPAAG